jgi:acyl-CoA synthetase (AMP-forming)/AMP-acid ligase II
MTRAHQAPTVIHALLDSAARTPEALAFRVIERFGEEFALSYADVCRSVGQTAAGLANQRIGEADRVVVVLPTSRDLLSVYLGCLYAGVVPLVAAEPVDDRIAHYAANLRGLVEHSRAKAAVVAPESEKTLAPLLPVPVLTPDALRGEPLRLDSLRAAPESLAHLQATSGSTGSPKLAAVRHGNIAANVQAIARAIRASPGDCLVSWLPLFHDMGLIGISYALNAGIPMVLSDPVNFLHNPISWLHWISQHRGTLSPAPNAAFHMCVRVAKRRPPTGLDLSRWRVALCGAEPVRESTMREFQAAFGPFGLPETTLRPVYGLAEATLAAAIPDVDRPYSVDTVDTEAVAARGLAEPRPAGDPRTSNIVSVGQALPGHRVRVVDPDGAPLPERTIGEIEVSGPSVIDGYLPEPGDPEPGNPAPALDTHDEQLKRPDGYLRTGDLGYQAEGALYITGRRKDIVIIAGRNYVPNQIETFVEAVVRTPRPQAIVAVGVLDPVLQTEQLHLLLDKRLAEEHERRALAGRVSDALAEVFGIGGAAFHWVDRAELPRTTSGKIQRHLCRKLVEERLAAVARDRAAGAGRAAG